MRVGEIYVNKTFDDCKNTFKTFVTLKKYINNDMWIVSISVYKQHDLVSNVDDFPLSGANIYKYFIKYTKV